MVLLVIWLDCVNYIALSLLSCSGCLNSFIFHGFPCVFFSSTHACADDRAGTDTPCRPIGM